MDMPCSSTSAALTFFRAKDKHSNLEMHFETQQEASEWMLTHRDWVLEKRDVVHWTFPLDKIIAKECWIKVL